MCMTLETEDTAFLTMYKEKTQDFNLPHLILTGKSTRIKCFIRSHFLLIVLIHIQRYTSSYHATDLAIGEKSYLVADGMEVARMLPRSLFRKETQLCIKMSPSTITIGPRDDSWEGWEIEKPKDFRELVVGFSSSMPCTWTIFPERTIPPQPKGETGKT